MGLITKTVKVKWNSRNKKHYVNLGYEFTKMGNEFEVKVKDLPKGSEVRVDCICDDCGCELDWQYIDYIKCVKENGNTYCRKCSHNLYGKQKAIKTKLQNSKSFEQWCIENNRQDVLNRWDYELNNCQPNEIPYRTTKKYWFKCDRHIEHKSELKRIADFTKGRNGSIECKQCNSFAQWMLDNNLKIEDYWEYDKNTISPWDISYGCITKVWIKCQEKDYHGSYEIDCNNFTTGNRCPYCSGRKVHPKDSLGQYIIDNFGEDFLYRIWSNKNKKSPFEYAPNSKEKICWKCVDDKHEDYKRSCYSSYASDFRCPQCSNERKESIGEEKVRLYLKELGHGVLHEHNCTIKSINPRTKMPLPYDNEIILDNGEHLLIEVHGGQHYNLQTGNSKWIKDLTPEQYLHERKLYDRYKRIYAIKHNYNYLEIPYTAFDKQETYKKLIDNKINEIKQIKNKD